MSGGLPRPEDWDQAVVLPDISAPRSILVAFDGSHAAERALAWAALVAGAAGGEVMVVVAYDPPITMRGRGALYVEEMKAALAAEANGLAEESVSLLTGKGVRARGLVVKGDIARGVLQVADDEGAELIVLGRTGVTHELEAGLERFRSLLSGGIWDKVSRHAEVPVLVVG